MNKLELNYFAKMWDFAHDGNGNGTSKVRVYMVGCVDPIYAPKRRQQGGYEDARDDAAWVAIRKDAEREWKARFPRGRAPKCIVSIERTSFSGERLDVGISVEYAVTVTAQGLQS